MYDSILFWEFVLVTIVLNQVDETESIVNFPGNNKPSNNPIENGSNSEGMIIDIITGNHGHCMETVPVHSNYSPYGSQFKLNDLTIYETRGRGSKILLIDIYDIFGFHPNNLQVADRLGADGDFKVIIPDFFRNSSFTLNNFSPKELSKQNILYFPNELPNFIETRGNWDRIIKKDLIHLIDYYKNERGFESFGVFGFCWGGGIALRASMEIMDIKAAGLVHPSWMNSTFNVNAVVAPLLLLPSKDDPDMIYLHMELQKKFGLRCGHRRFDDMFHGFAAARGNFDDPLNKERVEEVISLLKKFFDKILRL